MQDRDCARLDLMPSEVSVFLTYGLKEAAADDFISIAD